MLQYRPRRPAGTLMRHARLQPGVGEVAQYEDIYRLSYVRVPEGIIVGLAEQLR